MRFSEYVMSLILAIVLLSGMGIWSQASHPVKSVRSCDAMGERAPVLKGMSLYPGCRAARRG